MALGKELVKRAGLPTHEGDVVETPGGDVVTAKDVRHYLRDGVPGGGKAAVRIRREVASALAMQTLENQRMVEALKSGGVTPELVAGVVKGWLEHPNPTVQEAGVRFAAKAMGLDKRVEPARVTETAEATFEDLLDSCEDGEDGEENAG